MMTSTPGLWPLAARQARGGERPAGRRAWIVLARGTTSDQRPKRWDEMKQRRSGTRWSVVVGAMMREAKTRTVMMKRGRIMTGTRRCFFVVVNMVENVGFVFQSGWFVEICTIVGSRSLHVMN